MYWQVYWNAKGVVLCKIVAFLMLVLVFLPQVVSKVPSIKCDVSDPLSILHKHYQSGDLIIAGIMSHIYRFSNSISFRERPSNDLFDGTL